MNIFNIVYKIVLLSGISISQLWKGLEPPFFLHSGPSLMALYQKSEFQEDQRNFFFWTEKVQRLCSLKYRLMVDLLGIAA